MSRCAATASTASRTRPRSALAAGRARRRLCRWRAPTPKVSPSRPSSTSMASSPAISSAIRRLSRKARAVSKASLRYRKAGFEAALTGYRQRLHDEIVDVFDPVTFIRRTVNRGRHQPPLRHRGRGRLARSATSLRLTAALRLFARHRSPTRRTTRSCARLRRPKHSGSLALDGAIGPLELRRVARLRRGALDRQEVAPSRPVRALDPYWLAGARVAYAVRPGLELFARGSNLLDSEYQDAAGYRTEAGAVRWVASGGEAQSAGGSAIIAVNWLRRRACRRRSRGRRTCTRSCASGRTRPRAGAARRARPACGTSRSRWP